MDREQVRALLDAVAAGTASPDDALDRLAAAPYDALGHSLVDLHRALRTGDPEVVYGAGKTTAQVLDVVAALRAASDRAVLVTRCAPATVEALR
ncbi:MAG: 1-(5-phosphoribosyl)-5-amino-4-imidazole-carboxylate carboxylase, partial [Actinomycetota bacterium]|nr:1-(5-phosphoribosyl)-5-amino-4-imidazole-carboxylate carboxylase [Actinomycetota bacterium]